MEYQSYDFEGKKYDFVLSMKAKVEIEKAQKAVLKNPVIAEFALKSQNISAMLDKLPENDPERAALAAELSNIQAQLIPYMDDMGELDPLEVGYIVLSNYAPYRTQMNRELFERIVDDMEAALGIEAVYEFFLTVHDTVFTQLEKMRGVQAARAESRSFLKGKKN